MHKFIFCLFKLMIHEENYKLIKFEMVNIYITNYIIISIKKIRIFNKKKRSVMLIHRK